MWAFSHNCTFTFTQLHWSNVFPVWPKLIPELMDWTAQSSDPGGKGKTPLKNNMKDTALISYQTLTHRHALCPGVVSGRCKTSQLLWAGSVGGRCACPVLGCPVTSTRCLGAFWSPASKTYSGMNGTSDLLVLQGVKRGKSAHSVELRLCSKPYSNV